MSSGVFKFFAAIALVICLAGCKLTVVVGQGGSVLSKSGKRNCAEVSSCTFEVKDADFDDTFTPVPLPGYEFERWQSGAGYLCWNSTGPSCALSNTILKDVPAIQSLLASDAVLTIRPVFKATASKRLVVKDANGLVLGEVMDLKNGTDAAVRVVHVEEDGKQHGYMLDVNRMQVSDTYGYAVYWLNSNCTGKQAYVPSPIVLEPLFSNRYLVARRDKRRNDKLFLLQLSTPDEAKVLADTFTIDDGICTPTATKLPLVQASILEEDYGSRYMPPFGVYAQ